jgi:hypothetical protein
MHTRILIQFTKADQLNYSYRLLKIILYVHCTVKINVKIFRYFCFRFQIYMTIIIKNYLHEKDPSSYFNFF